MSDGRSAGGAPPADTVAVLAGVPLLHGLPEAELTELAHVLRRRDLPVGDVLWHQGDEAQGMRVVVEGRVAVSLRLPGQRSVEVGSMGPGEVLGEVPLLDGGHHSATARVVEAATVLALSRADFLALVSRRHPTAFA